MPEIRFRLRWPDETVTLNYSPSTVVTEFFAPGAVYELAAFIALSREALQAASDRVQERFGYPCRRASATLAEIERRCAAFSASEKVIFEGFCA